MVPKISCCFFLNNDFSPMICTLLQIRALSSNYINTHTINNDKNRGTWKSRKPFQSY